MDRRAIMSLDDLIAPCVAECPHGIACDRARSDHEPPHSGWDWQTQGDVHEWDGDVCATMQPLPIDPLPFRSWLSNDERAQIPWSEHDSPAIIEVELPRD